MADDQATPEASGAVDQPQTASKPPAGPSSTSSKKLADHVKNPLEKKIVIEKEKYDPVELRK